MKDPFDQVDQFAEALLQGRRPRKFRVPTREDASALRMATALFAAGKSGRPEPNPAFLERLRGRVRGKTAGRTTPSGRRGFLAAGLAGLAAGVGAGFGIGRGSQAAAPVAPGPAGSSAGGGGIPIVRDNGRWFPVARLSQLAEQATVRFTAGALEGHLVRRGNEIIALSAICSHLPCSLVFREQDNDFLCPCHDATFHPGGEQKFARRPYPPLTRFEAKVEGDQVMVWSIDA